MFDLHFLFFSIFFFNDTATTEIYTLSLHDALPISTARSPSTCRPSLTPPSDTSRPLPTATTDRKSTRLNSSHVEISYAVFCLKKKKTKYTKYKNITNDYMIAKRMEPCTTNTDSTEA